MTYNTSEATYFFTKNNLEQLEASLLQRGENLEEVISEFVDYKYEKFDIFLSHSYKDKSEIQRLYELLTFDLNTRNYKVYVDWLYNKELKRENVNVDTANVIRSNIEKSKCLIYATPINETNSKWMPWECGYMDGFTGNVAILPIMEEVDEEFSGEEFLTLYPVIKKDSNDILVATFHDGSTMFFDDWINKNSDKNKFTNYSFLIESIKEEESHLPGIGTKNLKNKIQFPFNFKYESDMVIVVKTIDPEQQ
ncbi:hypothetical protein KDU71_03845 [Carboxylicivirga sediminis]|uniref:TIR domain-containing protein n=1 Tax=Carboxylicivirga sediminis TaxID=2006564 RepID=A0A941F3J8_9BACT|nr:hypothetical protein [Carboxylicivirga sediminis]MBR8534680.1 hypothetical protein [Carboxylicivirga sediminis]